MARSLARPLRASLEQLREDVSSTIDGWKRRLRRREGSSEEWSPVIYGETGPSVELEDKDGELVLKAELPGLKRDDFHVEVTRDRVVIRGEKRSSREEKKDSYLYSECFYGTFQRAIPLPCEIDKNKAEAGYKSGILTIRMPKTETAKAKRVAVEVK